MYRRTARSDHRALRRDPYAARATRSPGVSPSIYPRNGRLSRIAAAALLHLPRVVAILTAGAILLQSLHYIAG